MWWFGNDSNIWILKSGICAYWAFKSLDLFGCKCNARGCSLIQDTQFFTECWARGSSGWNISGCNWMFVARWEICTRTSKLVSKVNFVISEIGMRNSLGFFQLLIHAFQSEILYTIKPRFFPNCCCLQQDIGTTRAVFHFLLSKHKWSQYYKLKSVLSVAIVFCQLIPKNMLSVPKCSIWVSVGMIYFTLFGNFI